MRLKIISVNDLVFVCQEVPFFLIAKVHFQHHLLLKWNIHLANCVLIKFKSVSGSQGHWVFLPRIIVDQVHVFEIKTIVIFPIKSWYGTHLSWISGVVNGFQPSYQAWNVIVHQFYIVLLQIINFCGIVPLF